MGQDGVLGTAAQGFIDFLSNAGFSVWQMLPVQAVDSTGSPYQGSSVHAGNPDFISVQHIYASGWLSESDKSGKGIKVDSDLIARALSCFEQHATSEQRGGYDSFKTHQQYWLDDYARYMSIKTLHKHKPWWEWPHELAVYDKKAVRLFSIRHARLLERYRFEQYLFFSQWREFRKRANDRGILLFGDMPILTAHDSVDVWAHRHYFKLDEAGQTVVVAGVPPDYFSCTGQRWGNPVYDWDNIVADHFHWWIERLRTQLELFDIVRIDHFRGFDALWEIPASCNTAEEGEWKSVPGQRLFQMLYENFGDLPLVAEDLGIISKKVVRLREEIKIPGMKVLQFAFDGDAKNPYLPHNHLAESLVCTGTHDNNTTAGWYEQLDETSRVRVNEYILNTDESISWSLIQMALSSVCNLAVIPMQDLLGLDASHRMNTPGTSEGNWRWQLSLDSITSALVEKCLRFNKLYDRC